MNMRAFVYAFFLCISFPPHIGSARRCWQQLKGLAAMTDTVLGSQYGTRTRDGTIKSKHGRVMKKRSRILCATIRFVNLYSRNGAVAEAVWVSKMLLFTKT